MSGIPVESATFYSISSIMVCKTCYKVGFIIILLMLSH